MTTTTALTTTTSSTTASSRRSGATSTGGGGSSRAQRAMRNLHIRLLEHLPFIRDLRAPSELLNVLLEDYHKYLAIATVEKTLNTQLAKDKKEGYHVQKGGSSESTESSTLRQQLKHVRDESQQAEEAATKAIDKHYRTMSRTLHPDRRSNDNMTSTGATANDDDGAFDRLTQARDCLKLSDKRRLYFEQMMTIAQINPSLVTSSHVAWVSKNLASTDQEEAAARRRRHEQQESTSASPTTRPLMIQGGIGNDIPRRPFVSVLSLKRRKIRVDLPVKANFCDYCLRMHVLATCADYQHQSQSQQRTHNNKDDNDGEYVKIGTIEKQIIDTARQHMDKNGSNVTEISLEVTLPISGVWDILWKATLVINDQHVQTPGSHQTRVDLTSEEQKRRRAAIVATNELAKQRAGDIHSLLRKLRGPRPDHLEIERRCDLLHEVVARGRSTLNRLLDLLRADHTDEHEFSNGIEPLREALQLAGPAKKDLEAQFQLSSKRDSLKSFKHYVAGLLESGEAAAWLRTVEAESLVSLGGETNRLYQLLVEGRMIAHHLELDAATLEAAAGRHDLFTPKQCETLAAKQKEAEEFVEKEAERAMMEAKEKREQEKKEAAELALLRKKQAEEEEKKRLLEARFEAERQAQLAAIRESEEMARGMAVEHPVHRLVEIKSLKSELGKKLNGTVGTIMYKEGDRYVVECQIDKQLRSFKPENLDDLGLMDESRTGPTTRNTSWNCDACTFLHDGDIAMATNCVMCNTPRDDMAPAPSQTSSSSPENIPVRVTKDMTTVKENDKKPMSKRTETKDSIPRNAQRCFHGVHCRYIRPGRPGCKFYHTPEEIAQAQAQGAEREKSKQTLFIPQVTVGWVIGKNGRNMKKVHQKSKAEVSINQMQMFPDQMRLVTFYGSQQSVDIAMEMVKELVAEYKIDHGMGPPASKLPPEARSTTPLTAIEPKPETMRDVAKAASPPQLIQPPVVTKAAVAPAKARLTPPSIVRESTQASQAAKPSPSTSDRLKKPERTRDVATTTSPPPPIQPAMVAKATAAPAKARLTPLSTGRESAQTSAAAKPMPTTSSSNIPVRLYTFLGEQKACLKGSPKAFAKWLATEDIVSLEDLAAAVSDDDYLHDMLQQGDGNVGVKGFKRVAFKKAVLSAVNQNIRPNGDAVPTELVCPISHVLMTKHPVIAADGYTYERVAIDEWFRKQSAEIAAAKQQIASGSDSQQAQSIIDRGILSPMTHAKMPNLSLTPNHALRSMARDFASGSHS